MNRAAGGVAGLLVGVLLTACRQSPEDVRADYCATVQEEQARLSELLAGDRPDGLLRALPVLRELAEQAPRDLTDDWAVLVDALTGLDRALADAGVDPGSYDADDPPASVDKEQRQAIARAADVLARPDVVAAYDGVKQQAVDVCGTPLFR